MNKRQTIKMVARNPMTGKREEVYPESEVTPDEMMPVFLSGGKWVTIPDTTAADVWDKWIAQVA